jgi:hypothetical protein
MTEPTTQPDTGTEPARREWIFTFGGGQTHPVTGESLVNRFVRIAGTDYNDARREMLARFGTHWCGQYDTANDAGVFEAGMTELTDLPEPGASQRAEPWPCEGWAYERPHSPHIFTPPYQTEQWQCPGWPTVVVTYGDLAAIPAEHRRIIARFIAERANRLDESWVPGRAPGQPTEALKQLAADLTEPGTTHDAERVNELYGKLLHAVTR